jgi:hypothetical protein
VCLARATPAAALALARPWRATLALATHHVRGHKPAACAPRTPSRPTRQRDSRSKRKYGKECFGSTCRKKKKKQTTTFHKEKKQ